MSDEVLAPIIAVVILLLLFLWVPTLTVCNDRCQKLLLRRRGGPGAKSSSAQEPSDTREAA